MKVKKFRIRISIDMYNLIISIKLNLRSGGGPLWVSGCSLCGANMWNKLQQEVHLAVACFPIVVRFG